MLKTFRLSYFRNVTTISFESYTNVLKLQKPPRLQNKKKMRKPVGGLLPRFLIFLILVLWKTYFFTSFLIYIVKKIILKIIFTLYI